MADHRYRPSGSGRRSPTFNPARASLPVGVGYNSLYNGDLHAIPTGRYDAVPRRTGDHHHRPATTTITTYNVTKEPVSRTTSLRDHNRSGRHRSSTIDTGSVKPIIVTTNHSRPHNSTVSSSHTSSSTSRRPESPSRDPYRSSEETYYTQPASSIRSRSHQRHQSATYEQDDFYRMRERMGGDGGLRAPVRPHSRQGIYTNTPRVGATGYAEDYEYTKPSDLARYDLDHDRPRSRTGRRDSFDRGANYYRPSVNVVTTETGGRPERRAPPTSGALDRYNKNAAAGIYERGSVAMPTLPPSAPTAPPGDSRRPGMLDPPVNPPIDRRSSGRTRPISLYQDPAPRMDDLSYRAHDEGVHRDRRERDRGDDIYRDDAVALRGFGLRPELLDQADHRRPMEPERRDIDEHRLRRDYESREPKRRSDEDLDKLRGRHERRSSVLGDRPPRVEESRDRKESKGEKMRDKVVAGLGVAAAAIGLGAAKEKEPDDKDVRVSPQRRRRDSELPEPEPIGSRATDRYKPRDADIERRSSPREEPVVVERRASPKERPDRREESRDRERERDHEREREKERQREKEREQRDKERDRERERERDREADRERERSRRDAEAKLSGGRPNAGDSSPHSDDSAAGANRRRHRASTFDPTDTKGLMDLKAELAAIDHEKPKEKDKPTARGRDTETVVSTGSDRQTTSGRERSRVREESRPRVRDESRGRELALVDSDQKTVRVVSPPRDKKDDKPIKGILKQPTSQFPEEDNPIREGVAPHKDDKTKKDVPQGARWTKINRRMVNPEALTIGKERFEVRDDFVIVLRVLSKEEIQAYATATAQLREMRRKEHERDHGDRDSDDRSRDEEDRRRRHRHRREEEESTRDRDSDRDRDRHRRHRRDDEDDKPLALEYDDHSRHHHQRLYRDKDLDTIASSTDDRR